MKGHILLVRQAGGQNACPPIDFVGGFNQWFAMAYNLTAQNKTIAQQFGRDFNPFENDATYFVSVLSLEELGATGKHFSPHSIPPTLALRPEICTSKHMFGSSEALHMVCS